MKAKEFIPASKPRNFVAKNQKTAGAGAHRDKKKEQKQGYEKHKSKGVAEAEKNPHTSALGRALYRDLSKQPKLSPQQVQRNKERWAQRQAEREQGVAEGFFGLSPKEKAKIQYVTAKISDIPGNWDHKNQQYTEQGLNDLKSVMKNEKYLKYALSLTADDFEAEGVAEVSKSTLARYVSKAVDAHGHADFAARMSKDDPTLRSYHKDQKRTAEKRRQGIGRAMDRMSKEGVDESWGQREFEIGGYTYMTEIDEEEDNRKIFHMIKTPDGKTVDVDFTPYAYMSKEDVKLYVKLGMPKRQGVGPLDSKQLQKMAQIKGIAMLDPEMARAGMK